MHEDEERTLGTLKAHRKIIDELIVAANGQVFDTAGDSVLAEFPSASYLSVASPTDGRFRAAKTESNVGPRRPLTNPVFGLRKFWTPDCKPDLR